jgi:hypothetical protein
MRLGLERPEIETWTGEAWEWDLDWRDRYVMPERKAKCTQTFCDKTYNSKTCVRTDRIAVQLEGWLCADVGQTGQTGQTAAVCFGEFGNVHLCSMKGDGYLPYVTTILVTSLLCSVQQLLCVGDRYIPWSGGKVCIATATVCGWPLYTLVWGQSVRKCALNCNTHTCTSCNTIRLVQCAALLAIKVTVTITTVCAAGLHFQLVVWTSNCKGDSCNAVCLFVWLVGWLCCAARYRKQ